MIDKREVIEFSRESMSVFNEGTQGFSISNPDHLNERFLLTAFSEVAARVYEAAR